MRQVLSVAPLEANVYSENTRTTFICTIVDMQTKILNDRSETWYILYEDPEVPMHRGTFPGSLDSELVILKQGTRLAHLPYSVFSHLLCPKEIHSGSHEQ